MILVYRNRYLLKIHIKSVEKFWIWTLDILKNIPEKTEQK
jgi:hypothetical protein